MHGLYYEEFSVGDKFTTPGKTMSQGLLDMLIGLGGYTLPLFNDEEHAKATNFKGRIAPGRVIMLMMGGLEEQLGIFDETAVALIGLDKLRIKNPLRAGDTIKVEIEIIDKRETKNPERGIIVHKESCVNQRGEVLLEAESTHLMWRKPKA